MPHGTGVAKQAAPADELCRWRDKGSGGDVSKKVYYVAEINRSGTYLIADAGKSMPCSSVMISGRRDKLSLVLVVIVAAIFLGERNSVNTGIGAAMVFAGGLILTAS